MGCPPDANWTEVECTQSAVWKACDFAEWTWDADHFTLDSITHTMDGYHDDVGGD